MSLKNRIEKELGIDSKYLEIIAKNNSQYKKVYINKKCGGKRKILHPSKGLKVIQRWIAKNIFEKFPVSEYSYAYSKNNSIIKNAELHKNSRYILHTDIRNFFPSITKRMLMNFFDSNVDIVNDLELREEDKEFIADICLYKGSFLVIGSPASPRISNVIMYNFDKEIVKLLKKYGDLKYSRYADDIIISSNSYIDEKIIIDIGQLMINHGFSMNTQKTYFMNKKYRRYVTGISIDNNNNVLSIGNRKYKEFERYLYNFLIKSNGNLSYIEGYLSYIRSVNRNQYDSIIKRYKKYDKNGEIFK